MNTLHLDQTCMIDINHGPGDYSWSMMSYEYLSAMRKDILDEIGIDILISPIMPDNQLLIKKQIPVKKIIQKVGDCLYVGSGMIFWGEAMGKSVHTTWDILPITATCMRRAVALSKIDSESSLPLKTITFGILN